jgi:hypothetical protein
MLLHDAAMEFIALVKPEAAPVLIMEVYPFGLNSFKNLPYSASLSPYAKSEKLPILAT